MKGTAHHGSWTLQGVVDRLGDRLRRSVAIDDLRLRLIAHSAHHGQGDPVRQHMVLEREAPPAALAWAVQHGLHDVRDVFRLPGNAELGLLPRVAIPIREDGHTVAYLWLIDADPPVSEEEIAIARGAAEQAAVLLSRERLAAQLARAEESVALRNLLDDDAAQRAQAAVEVIDRGLFVTGACRCVTVHPVPRGARALGERERLALDEVMHATPGWVAHRHALAVVRHDHAVVLVSSADPTVVRGGIDAFAQRLRDEVGQRIDDSPPVVAAVGGEQAGVDEAIVSYGQALHAARVAAVVRDLGPVADWERLGIYRFLAEWGPPALASDMLHPALCQLVDAGDGLSQGLLDALEAFLDEAGNTPRAAARLHLHRSTLYHRLRRVEELTGVDLDNGLDRLALHLGLKLLRLRRR